MSIQVLLLQKSDTHHALTNVKLSAVPPACHVTPWSSLVMHFADDFTGGLVEYLENGLYEPHTTSLPSSNCIPVAGPGALQQARDSHVPVPPTTNSRPIVSCRKRYTQTEANTKRNACKEGCTLVFAVARLARTVWLEWASFLPVAPELHGQSRTRERTRMRTWTHQIPGSSGSSISVILIALDQVPSNAMTSPEEHTSAESESRRLPHHRAVTDGLLRPLPPSLRRSTAGRSNPPVSSSRFSAGGVPWSSRTAFVGGASHHLRSWTPVENVGAGLVASVARAALSACGQCRHRVCISATLIEGKLVSLSTPTLSPPLHTSVRVAPPPPLPHTRAHAHTHREEQPRRVRGAIVNSRTKVDAIVCWPEWRDCACVACVACGIVPDGLCGGPSNTID